MSPVTPPRPSTDDRIRAALWFAERGFGIFTVWSTTTDGTCRCPLGPKCDNAGKHPITRNGFHDATTDEQRIRTLLSAGSDPNYGLVCPDGVFALDVDGEGIARLAELEVVHGPLPPTLRTQTAHGEHIFLRWPTRMPRPIGHLFGFVTRWGSGRDAGYVIGPRSVHASGAVYAPAGTAFDIAEVPESWALTAVGPPPLPTAFITVAQAGYRLPDRFPVGAVRYNAIRDYTAHLYNRRLSVPEMWPLVRDILAPRFDEPLDEQGLRGRFDRVTVDMPERLGPPRTGGLTDPAPVDPNTFPEPEDRGQASLSELGQTEYVEDLVRPGRIVVWAAEEGSGKSYAVAGELAIRVAVAGGTFADTWPVLETGRVLVLSEMHPDDDYTREDVVLSSLELDREALHGQYYRLDLMTAAGGRPALTVPEWRQWITEWLEIRGFLLLVIDTATGATQVDPWGREIQTVYASLRMMLAQYPALAVILIVHVRKPTSGRPEQRQLSDVLGEWGRWCDVVVMQENDGTSLDRAKITTRKRVRQQRRIVATKAGGLLVDAMDLDGIVNSKVPEGEILKTIGDHPGSSFAELGDLLGVAKDTAKRYIALLGDRVRVVPTGPRRIFHVFLAETSETDRSTATHDASSSVTSTVNPATHSDAPTVPDTGKVAATSDAQRIVSPIVRSNQGVGTAARTTPPKGGGGAAVRAASSPDRAATHDTNSSLDPGEDAPPQVVDSGDPETVACHFYPDHQTRHHRNGSGIWWCEICSPELETL